MTDGQRAIDTAVAEADRLQKVLKRETSAQVRSSEEQQIIKATGLSWFNAHRGILAQALGDDQIKNLDDHYRALIDASTRSTLRSKYFLSLKQIKKCLTQLQTDHVITLATSPGPLQATTSDTPPSFAPLIADPKMQTILVKRWQECVICVQSGAPLAATVMMGGILEGLLLAKINNLADKTPVFAAAIAPKDPKTGKTLQLKEWGLKNFIDVAHELTWISKTAKDIGEVVRDYRNYIHPQKELSHGINLQPGDAQMLWEVAKSMTVQILKP
jgi:hypothetical protein